MLGVIAVVMGITGFLTRVVVVSTVSRFPQSWGGMWSIEMSWAHLACIAASLSLRVAGSAMLELARAGSWASLLLLLVLWQWVAIRFLGTDASSACLTIYQAVVWCPHPDTSTTATLAEATVTGQQHPQTLPLSFLPSHLSHTFQSAHV